MKQIVDIKQLRAIQLDILSYVDSFCRANDIKYSISGGTLIGAVRHGGYIPWDDDIDILMIRKEYEKFIKAFSRHQSSYKVYTMSKEDSYPLPYAKVSDNRTIMEVPGLPSSIGVNIDVFPIDFVPDNLREQNKVVKKERFYYKAFVFSIQHWTPQRTFINNVIISIMKFFINAVSSTYYISSRMDKIAQSLSVSNTRGCLVWGYGAREIMPAKTFNNYHDVNFEDRVCMSIVDSHTYLSHLYGDYMQLPPVEKRVTHHEFKAWWK